MTSLFRDPLDNLRQFGSMKDSYTSCPHGFPLPAGNLILVDLLIL
jgi:hypothetical protein